MIGPLIAYDAAGNVVATLEHMVARDDDGNVVGLIDFAAHEDAGGKLREIWDHQGAAGSGTWPEWIGMRAHEFTVELGADKRITALVHKLSGHRRERSAIEAAIAARMAAAPGTRPVNGAATDAGAVDIRDLVGGPQRPLVLDDQGRTVGRTPDLTGTPAHLPLMGRREPV